MNATQQTKDLIVLHNDSQTLAGLATLKLCDETPLRMAYVCIGTYNLMTGPGIITFFSQAKKRNEKKLTKWKPFFIFLDCIFCVHSTSTKD